MFMSVGTSEVTEAGAAATLITGATTVVLALSALRSRPIGDAAELVGLGVRSVGDVAEPGAEADGAPSALGVGHGWQLECRHVE